MHAWNSFYLHQAFIYFVTDYRALYFAIGNFDLMTRHFPGSCKILLKNYRCNRKAVKDLSKFPNIRSSTAFLFQKNLATKVVIFSCARKLELFRVVA